ncbi:Ribosomal protein L14b/L23e [Macrophomina phaseolina MS6]|uniref:Large ribosomal subunit protein uL14m n=2 Tax=Macrophomina phaseolina TaxID=35725 RepID=K2R8Y0_MACPH|nr:Ribosomal protein L14b/L23e [Macrophomina phaseolina MS6]KAH7061108.1 ribosomal protein L14b/L23e [Macrophomina phaseolina]
MIQLKTLVNCIDNSGAAVVECVNVLRSKRPATIGDRIVVVVQKQRSFGPESGGGSVSVSAANKVRRGDIRHAVVVRTAKKIQRPDGSVVKFDDNACVLINKSGEPIGSRLNGVVGQELRKTKWSKILSLAPMHL